MLIRWRAAEMDIQIGDDLGCGIRCEICGAAYMSICDAWADRVWYWCWMTMDAVIMRAVMGCGGAILTYLYDCNVLL